MRQVRLDDFGIGGAGSGSRWWYGGVVQPLGRPGVELATESFLDDPEQVASGFAHMAVATAYVPFIEHGLALLRLDLLQGYQCAGLLLVLQRKEAFRQSQVLEFSRARYCTIYTITYSTVFLRIPKRVGFVGFRTCFGIRRQRFTIPKKGIKAYFGFVNGLRLWVTFTSRHATLGHALREHLQACRQCVAAQHRVFG